MLSGQARIQLLRHVLDPIDQRIHALYRRVDEELEADLLHDYLLVVRQIRHPVVQLQRLAESVLWKCHFVRLGGKEQASVPDLLNLVRVGLEQSLVQIVALEVCHRRCDQVCILQPGHLRCHPVDVTLQDDFLELKLEVELLELFFDLICAHLLWRFLSQLLEILFDFLRSHLPLAHLLNPLVDLFLA